MTCFPFVSASIRFNEPFAKGWVESYSQMLDFCYKKYKPFETDMCEGQSNLKKTMRLKDEPSQNATEAVKANWG